MKKIGLYIRVSTARQDQEGYSVQMQKARLIAYCKAKGWVVAGVYVDPGHSGASLDRPGIETLCAAVRERKLDGVLVYKLDRLSRSQKDTLYLIEDVFIKNGVDFVSLQESFDTSTIFGRAMVGILSVFAQMERETITERTIMGRAGRAEDGLWHGGGTDPIGYDYVDGALQVNPGEADQVRMVYELYASGCSVTEITRRMEGQHTKHGGWMHTSTVGNVLDNPLYAGSVRFDGVRGSGRHEAIVGADLDKAVKAMRARQRRQDGLADSAFLLTGFLRCGSCGARYFAHRRPGGSVVYSCHSRAKKNRKMVVDPGCKARHVPVADLDAEVMREVFRLAKNPALVDEIIKKRAAVDGSSSVDTRSEDVARIEAEMGRLMDLYQYDDLVPVGAIAGRIEALHADLEKLVPAKNPTVMGYDSEGAKVVLRDVLFGWGDMDVRGKRALLVQLIDMVHVEAGGVCVEWSF